MLSMKKMQFQQTSSLSEGCFLECFIWHVLANKEIPK